MIKKVVKGKDFDGKEYEETYYFHLTKGDLIDWATEGDGGLAEKIMDIAKEDDPLKIIPMMKKILIRSYGVKSPDGHSFIKDPEAVKNFQYSAAFSELYIELSTDADKAVEFIEGIIPEFDEETKKKIEEARKRYEEEISNKEAK